MVATALRRDEAGAPTARAASTAAYLEVRDLHAWYG